MPWSEVFESPSVEAACFGMFYRQRGDCDRQRDQEQQGCEDPEKKRAGSGMGGGGDPARSDGTRNDEEGEVAEAEFAF